MEKCKQKFFKVRKKVIVANDLSSYVKELITLTLSKILIQQEWL